jgi:FAD/FMN-containing dehydrogenase
VIPSPAVEELGRSFAGPLLRDGDEGYDEARRVWNGCFDRRPALIARCQHVADVQTAVRFATANDLLVAVRGGGHSAQGHSVWDGAMVIDLSEMRAVEVDPVSHIARAEGGATWADFDEATQEHGLALTGGRFSTTGIAGLTLGSGSGWLERRCGLTADSLLAAEVVTATGDVVTASADENPDLFWGLRGGGGNFGIVTTFTYRLHEIGPIIYGGLMACPPERAADILRFLAGFMPDAPHDLGIGFAFISAPPEPFVPPEMHFAPIVGIIVCWTGDLEEGAEVIEPLRAVAQPVMDMVQPIPYTALQSMLDGGAPYGTRAYMKAEFLPELSEEAIAKFVAHGAARPGPMVQLLLEPLGGAVSRVANTDTALGRRDVPWCFHAISMWMDPDDTTADAHVRWAHELSADVAPLTTTGVYLNFTSDEGEARVRDMFGPDRYERLVAIKDRWDPGNVFRLNQNIKPSAAG